MLVLQDIHIGYNNQLLARSVGNIAFAKARFIAIIGANGAGKTTLLKSLASGKHLLSGSISLNGKAIQEIESTTLAQQIAILNTDRSFSKSLTVQQLLEISRAPYTNFMGQITATDQAVIDQVMTDFDLNPLKVRQLSTLSDGQLQRALIARSLVQQTDYVLMDEPTSHLDIHHKAELLLKLKDYCKNYNKTIIFSTHEIAMATALVDQIVYFNDGYLRFKSTAEFKKKNILQQLFPSPFLEWKNGVYHLSTASRKEHK